MRMGVAGLESAESHQDFRQLYNGLLRVLAIKDGVLNVNALIVVCQVNMIDSGPARHPKTSGILSLIRTGVRGEDLSSALERGCSGDVKEFYRCLTSGNPITRFEGIGIRTDYKEFTLSSMLKA
ncbi:MAG: hypothetical protein KGH58_01550 [Candidatus Micrarchaeota archaeon]|nr:hypothetical protein [Candidatus Micrarchaeota archaeon]